MLVIEILPFKTQKQRIKLIKSCELKGGFSVHDNYICLYRKVKDKTWELEGYNE